MTDRVLITGAAGFIGFHLSQRLMREGFNVVGIDNLNDYYDPALKQMRLAALKETQQAENAELKFIEMDLTDREAVADETGLSLEEAEAIVTFHGKK